MARYKTLSAEQAEIIVRRLLREPLWNSPTAAELTGRINADDHTALDLLMEHASDLFPSLSAEERDRLLHHMERLIERFGARADRQEAELARMDARVWRIRALTARNREEQAIGRAREAACAAFGARVELTVERAVAGRVHGPAPVSGGVPAPDQQPPLPIAAEPVPAQQPPKAQAPLLSARIDSFFAAKRYPPHTEKQNRATLRLWLEIVGDRPTADYTEEDAYKFQARLRELPASHGKGGHVHALAAIETAKGRRVPRLTEKTIERHFSVLRQFWGHLGKRVADQDIWSGIEHKVEDGERIPWTDSALDRLLRAPWNPGDRPGNRVSAETHAWMVGIGGYTGARVEEIARLRVRDIEEIDGISCFLIRKHFRETEDGRREREWKTKSPAGMRAVPIHPRLIQAGILGLAGRRREQGAERLFDLSASGPAEKLAAEYSREFSRHKMALGIKRDIVFHSFRHNVETILGSKDFRQEWIDVFMGHKSERPGQPRKSVGVRVYLHGLEPDVLRQVAYAVHYPDHVCPLLLLKRIRGEAEW